MKIIIYFLVFILILFSLFFMGKIKSKQSIQITQQQISVDTIPKTIIKYYPRGTIFYAHFVHGYSEHQEMTYTLDSAELGKAFFDWVMIAQRRFEKKNHYRENNCIMDRFQIVEPISNH